VLQCVAVCFSVVQHMSIVTSCAGQRVSVYVRAYNRSDIGQTADDCCNVLQCIVVCCSVPQYVAVCCSVLQCVCAYQI